MSKENSRHIVTVPCRKEGYENNSIDIDVTDWSVYEFRAIPESDLMETIPNWVETDSVDWSIEGKDGKPIPHPGRGAEREAWLEAYKRMPLDISLWLASTPQAALWLASTPSKKSDGGG